MPLPLTQCQLLQPLPRPTSVSLLTGGPFDALGAWQGASCSPIAQPPAETQVDIISWTRELAEESLLETWGNQSLNPTPGHTWARQGPPASQ